ncbi:quinone-dependent dihydroorotate dehydrogenase [Parvularcula bermudensis]|nr:quinone-dependent dihydroorotate dehydrogenase [Parvularcula bermudensis]
MSALRRVDPERAHRLTIAALRTGIVPGMAADQWPSLHTEIAGLTLPNPLGLAAGFDKNAQVPDPCLRLGFGFVEVGAVTLKAQPGNPRPRVFRLPQDFAVINRYGFNNDGLEAVAARLRARRGRTGVVGVNLGANKDSADRLKDFAVGAAALSPLVDFCTVNVSSPNTPGLRHLQEADTLRNLLSSLPSVMAPSTRLFLKVAPDLTDEAVADLAELVRSTPVDALIVSNTTISRPHLTSDPEETGGLSGRPLFDLSTRRLRDFASLLNGDVPLIGVGGIEDSDTAYQKILNGASALQLYTALIYKGPRLVVDILDGLADRLTVDGYPTVADAVGAAHR